jgi:hypothetical protein
MGVSGEVNHGKNITSINNSEPGVVEADSMSEVTSLIKCHMEEVPVKWRVHFRVQNCLALGS